MPLAAAQTTAFFEGPDQMALSHRTRVFLQSEGINAVGDLVDFVTKDSWAQVVENCKRPPMIPDPANAGQMIAQEPFRLPAKSLMRLKVASVAVSYYEKTGRPLTAGIMMWNPRLRNFAMEMEALMENKKSNDELVLPIISSKLSINNWFEAYDTYAASFVGQCNCPLSLIYRDHDDVPGAAPALATDQPFSVEHGSIAEEMVNRFAHVGALFRADNATGFAQIVTATTGTRYASTIAPFKRSKDGRGALKALKAQFSGNAHWDEEIKKHEDFLRNRIFMGRSGHTLHAFVAGHRAAFHGLQRAKEHIAVELPNERTRVKYLMDNMKECNDKDVTAALAAIRQDDTMTAGANPTPSGMRNNFERAVAFLLPTDPVKGKKKRVAAEISAINGGSSKETGNEKGGAKKKVSFKKNVGETGVELRYHKFREYSKLTNEQKEELNAYHKANKESNTKSDSKKKKKSKKKVFTEAQIATLVQEKIDEREEERKAAAAEK